MDRYLINPHKTVDMYSFCQGAKMYVWHQNNTLTLRSCLIINFHLYAIYLHGKRESKRKRKISLYNSGLIATSGIWGTA